MSATVRWRRQGGWRAPRRSILPLLLLTHLILTVTLTLTVTVDGAHLQFALRTHWNATDITQEAAEFFTDAQQYYSFIQQYNQHFANTPYPTDQHQYDAAVHIASSLLGPSSLSVFRSHLALRSASPAVATIAAMRNNRIAAQVQAIPYDRADADELKVRSEKEWSECETLIAFGGELTCDVNTIEWTRQAAGPREVIHAFDRVHPLSADGPSIILYADPLSAGFERAHSSILSQLPTHALRYVLRLVSHHSSSQPLFVGGFGVELAIKNMEYKVLDDSRIEYENEEGAAIALPDELDSEGGMTRKDEDISGFRFNVLKQRRPDLASALDAFRLQLLRDTHEMEKKVKAWDMKDLGYQAAQRVLQSAHPLPVLRDLAQNFPMYAQALTRTKLNATVRAALERNSGNRQMPGNVLPPPGTNLLDVNGLTFDLGNDAEDLDIFNLLALLRAEASSVDELNALGLTRASVSRVLSELHGMGEADSSGAPDGSSFQLHMDLGSPTAKRIVTFINDIEKDSRYKVWPHSVQEYLAPSWPNQLKYVRKNCYTGVAIIDPAHAKGLDFITQARFFIESNAPIRIGFVFWIPQPTITSSNDGKRRVAWDGDVLSRTESDWDELVSEQEDAATDAAASVDPYDAVYNSIESSIAKCFYQLRTKASGNKLRRLKAALDFLEDLHELNPQRKDAIDMIELEIVWKRRATRAGLKGQDADLKHVLSSDTLNEFIQLNLDYVSERGFVPDEDDETPGQMPVMVVNGVVHRSAAQKTFREVMMGAIMQEQYKIMMKVYNGEIDDSTDIHAYLQSQPNVYKRINREVTALTSEMNFLPNLPLPRSTASDESLQYIYSTSAFSEDAPTPSPVSVTYWLVSNWSSERGLTIVSDVLTYLAKPHHDIGFRVAFLHNPPSNATLNLHYNIGRLAAAIINTPQLNHAQRLDALRQLVLVSRFFYSDPNRLTRVLNMLFDTPMLKPLKPFLDAAPSTPLSESNLNRGLSATFLSSLNLPSGSNALIVNGRVIALESEQFHRATSVDGGLLPDLRLLSEFTSQNYRLLQLLNMMQPDANKNQDRGIQFQHHDEGIDADTLSDAAMAVNYILIRRSLTSASGEGKTSIQNRFPPLDESSVACIKHDNAESHFTIRALIDPLSKAAQKVTPVLLALQDMISPSVRIWLSPKSGISEFPLKRFYRYALPTALQFDSVIGSLRPFGGAFFRGLTTKHILSTVVFTPESWSIGLEKAKYDLDNLNVAELGDSLAYVQYKLDHLLLFGHAIDVSKREHPAGLQLMLSTRTQPVAADTVVMQSLGYFQLKANPGEWTLGIADEKHAEVYEIVPDPTDLSNSDHDVDELNLPAGVVSFPSSSRRGVRSIFIRSFTEGSLRLDVRRKPGAEHKQLLDPSNLKRGKQGNVGSLWKSVFGGDQNAKKGDEDEKKERPPIVGLDGQLLPPRSGETIHVFSLASGHLYERFLKIMMQSVLDSTRNPVKFWFIKNFASPQFVEFVPLMAKRLGFEAEFVTYKWPVWLRRQEEKQRIIWGMKILFLDVLFPLAVPRIIYIDADQVVRGDIRELWEMDLEGAPYAYTPFCDSNKETEGFRFWKSGYWKDHLRGKPYHISALYVVDLDQFRLMRAGDTLRGIYDNLSADPNSLANLDQDLPNYAQHMVPIHSLPQQWLWCQTWCSMDTLPQAKTIDLCNNPLTKTPKLEVAKSLLPEWTKYDNQAKMLEQEFAATGTTTASSSSNKQHKRAGVEVQEETVPLPTDNAQAIERAQQTILQ